MKKFEINYLTKINNLEEAYNNSKDLNTFKEILNSMYENKLKSMKYYGHINYDKATWLREDLVVAYYLSSYDELRPIYEEYIIDLDKKIKKQARKRRSNFYKYRDESYYYKKCNLLYPELIEQIRNNLEIDTYSGDYMHHDKWSLGQKRTYLIDYIWKLENDKYEEECF